MFKLLLDRSGLMFAATTRKRAFYFFVSRFWVGIKVGPTTDPYPGIVELCDYDIAGVLRSWDLLSRVKLVEERRRSSSHVDAEA